MQKTLFTFWMGFQEYLVALHEGRGLVVIRLPNETRTDDGGEVNLNKVTVGFWQRIAPLLDAALNPSEEGELEIIQL